VVGENVTLKIRMVMYEKILRKQIGWFDDRDNSPGILTSAMAQDTSIINGVSTESLASLADSLVALFGGMAIAFFYCWRLSLVCLAGAPLMAMSGVLTIKFQQGLT